MKRKEFNDLRSKTIKELKKLVVERKMEKEKTKMKTMAGKEKNLKLAKNLSKEIAKILTLTREKEIIESLQPEVKKETEVKGVKRKEETRS